MRYRVRPFYKSIFMCIYVCKMIKCTKNEAKERKKTVLSNRLISFALNNHWMKITMDFGSSFTFHRFSLSVRSFFSRPVNCIYFSLLYFNAAGCLFAIQNQANVRVVLVVFVCVCFYWNSKFICFVDYSFCQCLCLSICIYRYRKYTFL